MNTRRKMFSGLVLAAAALLALSGCKKDEGEKVVLSAEFEQPAGGQKTYINDHSVRWTSGDKVRVNAATEAVAVSDGAVEVTANDNGYAVAYPFENSTLSGSGSECTGGSVVIPADQAYATTEGGQQKMSSPMAARLDAASGRLYFKNLHSLIRVDVTTGDEAFDLESITITSATANLAGTQNFTFTGGTTADAGSAPTLDNSTLDKKSVTLNFSEPLTLAANTEDRAFYLCVAPFTNTNLEIKVTGTPQGGTYAGKKGSYVFSRSGKSLNRSIMADVKADFGDADFEPIVYKFSVRAGLQVEFSPGNLQYCASSNTWRFAEHQYDYIGSANSSISSSYNGWIDLFGWGTSGWNNGNKCYQPYDNSNATSGEYASSKGYGYGPTDGIIYNISLSDEGYKNADWGVYNAIYNPKTKSTDAAGTWRTLTNAEWAYLLGTSDNTRGGVNSTWWIYNMVTIKAADGTNDVTGLIIYPDGVTAADLSGFTGKANFSQNSQTAAEITKAEFETLEAMGCVFLPAAGYRFGTSVLSAGSYGYYWSSTYSGSDLAYYLRFNSGYVTPGNSRNRYLGQSVRLVR